MTISCLFSAFVVESGVETNELTNEGTRT